MKNNIHDENNKNWVIMKGVVCDVKYSKYKPFYVHAILISFPYYMENDNFVKLFDDHIWLFVDNITYYKNNSYKNRTVKLAIGSTLTFIAHVIKYKNKKYRNGIMEWSPLNSNILLNYKQKNLVASNKKITAIVCIYRQRENKINILLNEKYYLEKEIEQLRKIQRKEK